MRGSEAPRTIGDLNEDERAALRTARTISVAMIVGVLIFGAVTAGISMSSSGGTGAGPGGGIKPPSLANVPQPVLMLAGLAGAMLLTAAPTALFMRKVMLTKGVDPATGRVNPGALLTATIVTLALVEAPALLGLVASMIGKSLWPGGVVSAVAVIVMIALVPRAGHFAPGRSRDAGVYGYREPEKWS